MRNNFLSVEAIQNNSLHTLFIKPYNEGWNNFKEAYSILSKKINSVVRRILKRGVAHAHGHEQVSVWTAFKHITIGVSLVLPIINTISLLAIKEIGNYTAAPSGALGENLSFVKSLEYKSDIDFICPMKKGFFVLANARVGVKITQDGHIIQIWPPNTSNPVLNPLHADKVYDEGGCFFIYFDKNNNVKKSRYNLGEQYLEGIEMFEKYIVPALNKIPINPRA